MADSTDRRSTKGTADPKQSQYAKSTYQRLKAAGICVHCKERAVDGRAYCHACSTIQVTATARWGARKLLAGAGIKDIAKVKHNLIGLHSATQDKALKKLIAFLEAVE